MLPLVDYHVHTSRCGHAVGESYQYVEKALELGLKAIGFADHVPMYWLSKEQRDSTIAMTMDQLPAYVEEVLKLRDYYTDIEIRLGLEVDFVPGYETKARQIIDAFPLDYVLGSVHYIDGWGFDNPALMDQYAQHDAKQLYHRYFHLVQQAAQSKLFDVMAHLDLIKKFNLLAPPPDIQHVYHHTARILAQNGVAVEINTGGLRAPVRQIYPAPELLKACLSCRVPIALGSDAHAPEQVGYGFGKAQALYRAASLGH